MTPDERIAKADEYAAEMVDCLKRFATSSGSRQKPFRRELRAHIEALGFAMHHLAPDRYNFVTVRKGRNQPNKT